MLLVADGVISHCKNLTVLRAVVLNLHGGCRTALRAVDPMSGVGQNLLYTLGEVFFTLQKKSFSIGVR